ncbi:MAG: formamidopyrimidine-DNA glycosylase [Parcubacteria group bacterium Gr01-1014_73]|nr:MAG: formamidopyrimidine-DNA glycosylase [Parcubacteria group bacterium Gr01-1014_73]
MPELPEVQTTVNGLNRYVRGLVIKDVWTDYYSEFHLGKPNIKDRKFFKKFRTSVIGAKIFGASRRAKNVLLQLSNGKTILIHMKMTGCLLYGNCRQKEKFIHVIFTLSNGKDLALSDLRKFAKVTLIETGKLETDSDLKNLGPEPLEKNFTWQKLHERLLKKPNGKIKQVLMAQDIIAGIGNIYSDEMLWHTGVHPLTIVKKIPPAKIKKMYRTMKKILRHSIKIGGDSESDYRNILGQRGNFQNETRAYGHEGEPCTKPNCRGILKRLKIGGRSAHFCPEHQKRSIIKS